MLATNLIPGTGAHEFITMQQLLQELTISRATAYRWIKSGDLPRPIKLGPSRIVFLRSELDAHLAERPRA